MTGQVLKLMAAKPDAVLIAGSGTPAALPQKTLKERGYTGKIYQTHGVANDDFLRVGGKDVEGTFLPAGPVLVAEQLPDSHPVKKTALAYVAAYEAAYGKGTRLDLRRPRLGRRPADGRRRAGRAEEGAARHAGIPRRAARRARAGQGSARRARHLQHVADRPPRPRPARPRDGQDRERHLEVHALNDDTSKAARRAPLVKAQGAPAEGALPLMRGPPGRPQPVSNMDFQIALLLVQDGIINGAIYG